MRIVILAPPGVQSLDVVGPRFVDELVRLVALAVADELADGSLP